MYIIKEATVLLYHTSIKKIYNIKNTPLFFTDKIELAKAWYKNAIKERGKAFVYSFNSNGKILSREQIKAFCKKNKIDYYELISELVGNPDTEDIINIKGIKEISKICDGFRLMDYDPRNFQKDAESILILNTKTLKNQKLVSFDEVENNSQTTDSDHNKFSEIEKTIADNWKTLSKKTVSKTEIDRNLKKNINLTSEKNFKPLISKRIFQELTYIIKNIKKSDFLKIVKDKKFKVVSGKKFGIDDFIPIDWE